MHKTTLLAALAMVALATPAAAQHVDPTTKVTGSGVLPAGWNLRFDPPAPAHAHGDALKAIVFETVDSGFRIASGPAAIYYKTGDVAKGEFAVSATFTQNKDMGHEAAGLFFGGSNLMEPTQNYVYFVIRAQDGTAMISQRTSDKAPKALKPYFAHSAINKQDKNGNATNAITIHAAPDTVHFVVNGQLVAALAKSQIAGGTSDGQVGMRVNHNMDLRITRYNLQKQ